MGAADIFNDVALCIDLVNSTTKKEYIRTQYDEPLPGLTVSVNNTQGYLRGKVASVMKFKSDMTKYDHGTHYGYDTHGNVRDITQELVVPYGLVTRLHYDYDLQSGKVTQVHHSSTLGDEFYHRYVYDADNRLTSVLTSQNGTIWDEDARYYYYLHGPLARLELGQEHVQGLDYSYTLQGWIKGVNSASLRPQYDPSQDAYDGSPNALTGRDAVGYILDYNQCDYNSIGSQSIRPNTGGTPSSPSGDMYNGNISQMFTAIRPFMNDGPYALPSGNIDPRTQGPALTQYSYDQLHRIMGMQFWMGMDLNANNWLGQQSGDYAETYSYDANGNIQTLQRNGAHEAWINGHHHILQGLAMDDLTYHYGTGDHANRLEFVTDGVPDNAYSGTAPYSVEDIDNQSAGNYEYDLIGRLIRDNAQGISIYWNVWDKVDSVVNTTKGITTHYAYDALGNRVAKTIRKNASMKYTMYSRDHSGNTMATYTGTDAGIHAESAEIYGAKRLGTFNYMAISAPDSTSTPTRVLDSLLNIGEITSDQHEETYMGIRTTITMGTYSISKHTSVSNELYYIHTRVAGSRQYELSNHLGNVLATVSDRKLPVAANVIFSYSFFDADILSATDYYPFGMAMPGRTYKGAGYKFGFNGKENDSEGEWGTATVQDYGFRLYNPNLCRFFSVDPLTAKYPELTPYQFASNTPIMAIDLDGLEAWKTTRQWNECDIEDYAKYSVAKLQEFKAHNVKDDCANFAVRLIIGYASENGLPLTLTNHDGQSFSNEDVRYKNVKRYQQAVLGNTKAKDLVNNANTFQVEDKDTHPGDIEVLHYTMQQKKKVDFYHVVIFENVDVDDPSKSRIVYGNLYTDGSGAELKETRNWVRLKPSAGTKFDVCTGDYNSRWKVLDTSSVSSEKIQDLTNKQDSLHNEPDTTKKK